MEEEEEVEETANKAWEDLVNEIVQELGEEAYEEEEAEAEEKEMARAYDVEQYRQFEKMIMLRHFKKEDRRRGRELSPLAKEVWDMFGDERFSLEKKYKAAEEFKRLVADHPARVAFINERIQDSREYDELTQRRSFFKYFGIKDEGYIDLIATNQALSELGLRRHDVSLSVQVKQLPKDKEDEVIKIRDRIAERLQHEQEEPYERANDVWKSLDGVPIDQKKEMAVNKYEQLTSPKGSSVPEDY